MSLFTLYPEGMECGLEVECGQGTRIRGGRKKRHNIFGINSTSEASAWKGLEIELYCKVAHPTKIPYNKDSFDWVFLDKPLDLPKEKMLKALKEIYRVGWRDFCLTLPTTESLSWWLKKLRKIGYEVFIANVTSQNTYHIEAKKGG